MSGLRLDRILETAFKNAATGLVFEPGKPPVLEINGVMHPLEHPALSADDTTCVMRACAPDHLQNEFKETGKTEFDFNYGSLFGAHTKVEKCEGGGCKLSLTIGEQTILPSF